MIDALRCSALPWYKLIVSVDVYPLFRFRHLMSSDFCGFFFPSFDLLCLYLYPLHERLYTLRFELALEILSILPAWLFHGFTSASSFIFDDHGQTVVAGDLGLYLFFLF